MRVLRTILGVLLLTIGLPLLLAGAGLWIAMQHRDAGGAFSGDLEEIRTPGYAVVVTDVDALLRRQAPFARADQTRLRITAQTADGPAFIGLAPAEDTARFLAGVAHARVDEVKVTRGALPVRSVTVAGEAAPGSGPRGQSFWTRSGTGALEWSPASVRGRHLALVIMAADGQPVRSVAAAAELRPGWLNSSTWGLFVLGSVTLLLGIVLLGWPSRTREVVYVVDPSQVPDIAARLGVPVPTLPGARKPANAREPEQGGGRPTTLAESAAVDGTAPWPPSPASPPVVPKLAWPPVSAQVRPETSPDATLPATAVSEHSAGTGERAADAGQRDDTSQASPATTAWDRETSAPDGGAVAPGREALRTDKQEDFSGTGAVEPGAGTVQSGAGAHGDGDDPLGGGHGGVGQRGAAPNAGEAGSGVIDSVVAASGAGPAAPPAEGAASPSERAASPSERAAQAEGAEGTDPTLVGGRSTGPGRGERAGSAAVPGHSAAVPVPPAVVPARTRRRRTNAAPEQGKLGNDGGERRGGQPAGADGQPEAPTGAGIAAAVAAGGRRPTRPRTAGKAKPAKNDADQLA